MTGDATPAPGLWPSPLSPAGMASALRLDAVVFDGATRRLVWLEGRSGQGVLVVAEPGEAPRDVTNEHSVRARVGYGGGDFTVGQGLVVFAGDGGRLYRLELAGGEPRPITPPYGQCCSPCLSPDGRWVLYIHSNGKEDCLAVVDSRGEQWPQKVATGHAFYMWPRWSPDGRAVAYVCWDHPAMPWDETRLVLCDVTTSAGESPRLGEPQPIAGGEELAVAQPEFSPDGRYLAYLSDETGWSQLYGYDLARRQARQLTTAEAEHAGPAWAYEMRCFAWAGPDEIVYRRDERGFQRLCRVDLAGREQVLGGAVQEYVAIDSLVANGQGDVAFVGTTTALPARIVLLPAADPSVPRLLKRSAAESIPAAALAAPEPVSWRGDDDQPVHGLYYPPARQGAVYPRAVPLVVLVHGGPTSHSKAGFTPQTQFLATRGYGVLAVNYRGSTAHGRDYMLKLRDNWGVFDVQDALSGARHFVDAGRALAEKLVIMGGSAGGYTVLQTMVDHPTFFCAGVCLYGISDQFAMAAETHKYEERYLDSLLGRLPEAADIYRARSPLFHADRIVRPLVVFQGTDDRVVPRNQSDEVVASLKRRGVPHEYHVYEGEGHGWRKRETIEAFYTALEAFLKRHVIFA